MNKWTASAAARALYIYTLNVHPLPLSRVCNTRACKCSVLRAPGLRSLYAQTSVCAQSGSLSAVSGLRGAGRLRAVLGVPGPPRHVSSLRTPHAAPSPARDKHAGRGYRMGALKQCAARRIPPISSDQAGETRTQCQHTATTMRRTASHCSSVACGASALRMPPQKRDASSLVRGGTEGIAGGRVGHEGASTTSGGDIGDS